MKLWPISEYVPDYDDADDAPDEGDFYGLDWHWDDRIGQDEIPAVDSE